MTAWGNAENDVRSAPIGIRGAGMPEAAAVATRTGEVAATPTVDGSFERRADTGVVVALSAIGLDDVRGVMAITSPATATTASAPMASAARWLDDPVSMSALVGPSSDGCRHVRS